LVYLVARAILRRRASLVSKRGFGVAADVQRLNEVPRVRIREVSIAGPDIARLRLVPARTEDAARVVTGDIAVALNASDAEYALLREWLDRGSDLGIVMPEGTELIRLRNVEDLQPLTLRRVEDRASE
jgi:hypothetical protein